MISLRSQTRTFFGNRRGSVALIFSLAAPGILALVGGAIEFADLTRVKARLQLNVDAAALSGAQQLAVQPRGAVDRARLQADSGADPIRPRWTISTSAEADLEEGAVTVAQDGSRSSYFGALLPAEAFRVHVLATAKTLSKKVPLCVLGLQQQGSAVLNAQDGAIMTAAGCLVQSDSDLQVTGAAQIRAGLVRSVGAARGSITPAPVTDAPVVADPFSSMPINVPTTCTDTDFKVSGTTVMNPGVHCGNIKIKGSDQLILNPGEHYFLDTQIDVKGKGQVTGTDVALIFSGKFDFSLKGQASFSIEGRRSGLYAGFAIVTDRNFTNTVELSTDSARAILGTIYLPAAKLLISGTGNKVADQSDWTVVVSNSIQIQGTAELVINSNYASSSVPLPSAIATSTSPFLSR